MDDVTLGHTISWGEKITLETLEQHVFDFPF